MNEPVPVPVLEGIEAVRRSGRTNMLDRPRVAQLCDELGFYEAALWVHEHRDLYARGIFHGFRAEPDDGASAGHEHDPDAERAANRPTTSEPAEGEDPRGAGIETPNRDPKS
jgi:hypothetical protein